jgi:hypothetical protein
LEIGNRFSDYQISKSPNFQILGCAAWGLASSAHIRSGGGESSQTIFKEPSA